MAVEMFFDFLVRYVIGDQLDVGRNLVRGVILALDDGEQGPLGMFVPEV